MQAEILGRRDDTTLVLAYATIILAVAFSTRFILTYIHYSLGYDVHWTDRDKRIDERNGSETSTEHRSPPAVRWSDGTENPGDSIIVSHLDYDQRNWLELTPIAQYAFISLYYVEKCIFSLLFLLRFLLKVDSKHILKINRLSDPESVPKNLRSMSCSSVPVEAYTQFH